MAPNPLSAHTQINMFLGFGNNGHWYGREGGRDRGGGRKLWENSITVGDRARDEEMNRGRFTTQQSSHCFIVLPVTLYMDVISPQIPHTVLLLRGSNTMQSKMKTLIVRKIYVCVWVDLLWSPVLFPPPHQLLYFCLTSLTFILRRCLSLI